MRVSQYRIGRMKVAVLHSSPCHYKDKFGSSKIDATTSPVGIPALDSKSSLLYCGCSVCKDVIKNTTHWAGGLKAETYFRLKSNVKLGDRVLVQGRYAGVVRYIGDLDRSYSNDEKYVGVKLDDPVGESDGLFNGKRFFKCPPNHGLIVPINQVAYIPIPGRNYDKRLIAPHSSDPKLSKRCSKEKVLKWVEKSSQIPTIQKATQCSESSFFNVRLSQVEKKDPSLDDVEDNIAAATAGQLTGTENCHAATPAEIFPANGTATSDSQKCKNNLRLKLNANCNQISKQQNDDYVSAWIDHIQRIKNSPDHLKIFIKHPLIQDGNCKDEKCKECSKVESVKPKIYTSHLLSGLPKEEIATPDIRLKDVEEFSYWMKHWGGGIRGWKMAQMRQRLKNAQRLGTKQIKWQETIDGLEGEEEFRLQAQRIKSIREELLKVRSARQHIDRESEVHGLVAIHKTSSDKIMFHYLTLIEEECTRIKELESSIAQNPVSLMIDMSKLMNLH